MATKTAKKGSKSGKKATRKRGEDRNETPGLECPHVANLTRPHTTESAGKLAAKLPAFLAAKVAWTASVRKAFADADAAGIPAELPIFPQGKFPNLNSGQMTRKAYQALVEEFNEAEAGVVRFPPRYQPAVVDAIHASNAVTLRRGSLKAHSEPPEDWDEKLYGPWHHSWVDEEGETQEEPSGWYFDPSMPRRCHAVTAETMIDDPETDILAFSNRRYVVGTGTHDGAAAFKIWQTERGNYRHGDEARKRMSLAGNKAVRDVVFLIEDRPNNGGGVTVKGKWTDVDEMVFMPGQVLTAGNLYDSSGKMLTAKEIRALSKPGDVEAKGIKFKTLPEPIVGKVIPWGKLWEEIKTTGKAALKAMKERGGRSLDYEAGDTQTKSITNITVNGKRVDPSEATPFGLKGGQSHMPAHIVATGKGKIEEGHFGMGVVIGERANQARNVGVVEARAANAETAPKAPAKPKATKKKAVAKKAAKKAEPKAKKATKKKAKPSDAAPPVESDTKDDPDPVTAKDEIEVVGVENEE